MVLRGYEEDATQRTNAAACDGLARQVLSVSVMTRGALLGRAEFASVDKAGKLSSPAGPMARVCDVRIRIAVAIPVLLWGMKADQDPQG